MQTIKVPIQFQGVATVLVPDHLKPHDATILANKLTLAQILATADNPDCGEALEAAFEECEAFQISANDFDAAKIAYVVGEWK